MSSPVDSGKLTAQSTSLQNSGDKKIEEARRLIQGTAADIAEVHNFLGLLESSLPSKILENIRSNEVSILKGCFSKILPGVALGDGISDVDSFWREAETTAGNTQGDGGAKLSSFRRNFEGVVTSFENLSKTDAVNPMVQQAFSLALETSDPGFFPEQLECGDLASNDDVLEKLKGLSGALYHALKGKDDSARQSVFDACRKAGLLGDSGPAKIYNATNAKEFIEGKTPEGSFGVAFGLNRPFGDIFTDTGSGWPNMPLEKMGLLNDGKLKEELPLWDLHTQDLRSSADVFIGDSIGGVVDIVASIDSQDLWGHFPAESIDMLRINSSALEGLEQARRTAFLQTIAQKMTENKAVVFEDAPADSLVQEMKGQGFKLYKNKGSKTLEEL